jgi:xylulose-5-phosphate/fructose-6-phosphate phosphoketolase
MLVKNNVSRYHLAIRALRHAAKHNSAVAAKARVLTAAFEAKLVEHNEHILRYSYDPHEIKHWSWRHKEES